MPSMDMLVALEIAKWASLVLTGVIGARLWFGHVARLRSGVGRKEIDGLAAVVGRLTEHAELMRGDFQTLHDRLDFAERVLEQGDRQHRLAHGKNAST